MIPRSTNWASTWPSQTSGFATQNDGSLSTTTEQWCAQGKGIRAGSWLGTVKGISWANRVEPGAGKDPGGGPVTITSGSWNVEIEEGYREGCIGRKTWGWFHLNSSKPICWGPSTLLHIFCEGHIYMMTIVTDFWQKLRACTGKKFLTLTTVPHLRATCRSLGSPCALYGTKFFSTCSLVTGL